MTLNIQEYYHFDARRSAIVSLIKKYDPDIVALQEIRDDHSKNKLGFDQAKQLNLDLNFTYLTFLPTMDLNKIKKRGGEPCYEGVALLSKFPFSSRGIPLRKHKDDIYKRKILSAKVKLKNKNLDLFVVHFSPNDLFARLHAEEALSRAHKTIILGDFNLRHSDIKKLARDHGYVSSTEYEYISYPADKCSYDHIFIPKPYSFLHFECIPDQVSDHRALFAEIKLCVI